MAVRFYLAEMIRTVEAEWVKESHAVSNYRTLVDELDLVVPAEKISFVTFHYDTLLERAIASDTDRQFSSVAEYVSASEGWNVFKLHGSYDWLRRVELAGTRTAPHNRHDVLIRHAADAKPMDEWTKDAKSMATQTAIPALAIPFVSKQDFACPPDQVEYLRQVLPTVDRVLAIGWRATDDPFLALLHEHAAAVQRVDCVTSTNPEIPLGRLAAVLPQTMRGDVHHGGFSKLIATRALRRLLA